MNQSNESNLFRTEIFCSVLRKLRSCDKSPHIASFSYMCRCRLCEKTDKVAGACWIIYCLLLATVFISIFSLTWSSAKQAISAAFRRIILNVWAQWRLSNDAKKNIFPVHVNSLQLVFSGNGWTFSWNNYFFHAYLFQDFPEPYSTSENSFAQRCRTIPRENS